MSIFSTPKELCYSSAETAIDMWHLFQSTHLLTVSANQNEKISRLGRAYEVITQVWVRVSAMFS